MIRNRGITFKLIFFILTSCTFIFAAVFGYNYLFSRRIILREIEDNAEDLTLLTVNRIETVLRPIEKIPQALAFFLEESACRKEELLNLLRLAVENNPEIYGAAIAFEPYAFEKDSLYFSPYFYKDNGKTAFTYLGGSNYQYFYWDWYQIPKELARPVWSQPYYDEGGGNIIMSTYSVPFYRYEGGEKRFSGVVTADVSLLWLQDIVSSIKIAETGYGFLVSNNGTIVTHPYSSLIMNETIFSVAEARQDKSLRRTGKDMLRGGSGFVPFESIVTGKKCWMAYSPIPSTGWSLGVLFPQNELMADITRLNWTVFGLGFLGFFFLFLVIVLISGTITRPLRKLASVTRDIAKGNLDFDLRVIDSSDEVGNLTRSFVYMKEALKRYIKELKETTKAKERIESELKIAHDIQMGIVPKAFPAFPKRQEFDIYALLEPAREVGGDFYDFFFIDKERLCFVIGDVSGKGVPAALFMAVVKTMIKATAYALQSPDNALEKVNKELSKDNDLCMFVTVFCGILDTKTGKVSFTNAGHNPPLIARDGREAGFLESEKNIAMGIDEEAYFKKDEVILSPGEAIYMYTDGVTEAFNKDSQLFSEERLKDAVSVFEDNSAQEQVRATLAKIKDFARGAPQSDDITIMALKYLGPYTGSGDALKAKSLTLKNDISELKRLKEAVSGFGAGSSLPYETVNDINQVLEEVVSNIIYYGYRDSKEHDIDVDFKIDGREITLKVSDDAEAFNPLEVPEPDISKPVEERRIGGLGVYIARKFADKIEYARQGSRNILTIRKTSLLAAPNNKHL